MQTGGEPAPLSLSQRRILSLGRLGLPSALSPSFRIAGPLDRAALERALRTIVRRHPILRSRIAIAGGAPVQIPTELLPSLELVDLSSIDPLAAERRIRELHDELLLRPFAIERGPLIRARLVRMSPIDHALLVACDHLAFDEGSDALFARELRAHYEAELSGEPPVVEPIELSYGDWAKLERDLIESGELEPHLAWWIDRMSPPVPALPFPVEAMTPETTIAAVRAILSSSTVERIETLSRQLRATPFMVLLAAFDLLIHLSTGAAELCTFTSVPLRPRPALEPLIGLFGNFLPLRIALGTDRTFADLVQRVRGPVLNALAHREVPFDLLYERLLEIHGAAATPRRQLYFVLHEESGAFTAGGATFTPLRDHHDRATFELALIARRIEDRIELSLNHRADLREPAEQLSASLVRLLDRVLANPDLDLEEIGDLRVPSIRTAPAPSSLRVAPRNDTEARLAALWKNLLGLDHVSITDNFFAVGGDSLLVLRLFEEIERAFGVRVTFAQFMRAATIAKLSDLVRRAVPAEAEA